MRWYLVSCGEVMVAISSPLDSRLGLCKMGEREKKEEFLQRA
jgi:hypothetical protein